MSEVSPRARELVEAARDIARFAEHILPHQRQIIREAADFIEASATAPKGEVVALYKCPVCGGTGEIDPTGTGRFYRRCGYCGGTGKTEPAIARPAYPGDAPPSPKAEPNPSAVEAALCDVENAVASGFGIASAVIALRAALEAHRQEKA